MHSEENVRLVAKAATISVMWIAAAVVVCNMHDFSVTIPVTIATGLVASWF